MQYTHRRQPPFEYTNLSASSAMATTPFFLWATNATSSSSSSAAAAAVSDHDVGGLRAEEETAAAEATQLSPELAAAVARPRLRRQASSSSPAKQQQQQVGGGGSKRAPQRGLGVAELERLRCGGDPFRDLNAAVAAMGDAAAAIHRHHHHLPLPALDADVAGGGGHYAPLLVRPALPPLPPPPAAAPFCHLHSSSSAAAGHNVAPPELQFLRDRCMGGFAGAGQLLPLAPEHPSSQSNTIWRPASSSSSSSCLPATHRCDLCSKTMVMALAERGGARGAATTTTNTPDYSIYDLAAAMATARKEKGHGVFLGRERKNDEAAAAAEKEVREIEFFPTSTTHADESEFAAAPFSSSAGGGCGAVPLDLSLRL
ncbi:hypothetical protein DAI22_05g203900 [Oryza sativa Japonica Group]|nr:AT-rich binding protein [Oryza sativa Japonica Group]KAF2931505.1 hypothetical protein DAI22_05g203900 [Oryza sativa Japonica Group]